MIILIYQKEVTNMEWCDDWRNNIPSSMLTRLAECRNKATDVITMATEMHKCNPDKTAEECFERMLEWVGDWNGQLNVFEQIDTNWDWYLSRVK
jgi:hypothetical protein